MITKAQLRRAVVAACTCGYQGGATSDPCGACDVWHRALEMRRQIDEEEARGEALREMRDAKG